MNLVKFPNKALSTVSEEVTIFDEKLDEITKQMIEVMNNSRGIGLAANQVGITKRIFVMHVNKEEEPYIFINPIISNDESSFIEFNEGCLSFPGVRQNMTRKENVNVTWQNIKGEFQTKSFKDLEAICIQHENDHINGITFIDHLSPLKKQLSLKKMKKH